MDITDRQEYIKNLEDTVKILAKELLVATDCLTALSIRRKREMDDLMTNIDISIIQSKSILQKVKQILP